MEGNIDKQQELKPDLLNLFKQSRDAEKSGRNDDVIVIKQDVQGTNEMNSDDKSFYTVNFLKSREEKPLTQSIQTVTGDGDAVGEPMDTTIELVP